MIIIEAMGIDNFFVSAGLVFGFVAGFAPSSIAGLALGSIASASGSVFNITPVSLAGPAIGFVNDFTPGSIIILAFSIIAGRVVSIVMDFKTTFFYGK